MRRFFLTAALLIAGAAIAQPVPVLNPSTGVTISTSQTITGTKTFSATILAPGVSDNNSASATFSLSGAANSVTTSSVASVTIAPPDALAANDLVLELNTSAGSQLMSVDVEGDVAATAGFASAIASGSNAYSLLEGARLCFNSAGSCTALMSFDGTEFDLTQSFHLTKASGTPYFGLEQTAGGASTFYFISGGGAYLGFSGSNLYFGTTASVGGAVTAVGNISNTGVFTGTGFVGSTTGAANTLTSNTAAASTTASVPALALKPANALDANDLVLDVRKSDDTSLLKVDVEGDTTAAGSITATGAVTGTSLASSTTGAANTLTSSTSAATASSSVPAWAVKPSGALDANDLVLDVRKSDDTSLLKVDVEGDTTIAGALTVTGGITGSGAATVLKVANDFTFNSTSFADITGLSWSVAANTAYGFRCYFSWESDLATTGATFATNGPASPTRISTKVAYQAAANAGAVASGNEGSTHIVAYDTGPGVTGALAGAAGTEGYATMEGTFVNGANAGTFAIRAAIETGSTDARVNAGSYCVVH